MGYQPRGYSSGVLVTGVMRNSVPSRWHQQMAQPTPRPVGTPDWVYRADEAARVIDYRIPETRPIIAKILLRTAVMSVIGFALGYLLS